MKMRRSGPLQPATFILLIYLLCYALRLVEYLVLRTDQTILGEAIVHKLAGIIILVVAVRYLSLKWADIGFVSSDAGRQVCLGLGLGFGVFFAAYGIEFLTALWSGGQPALQLYVTSYAVTGNQGYQTGLIFFVLCIMGNVVNVAMEEGVFRGLFLRVAERQYNFVQAVVLSSVLFGLWHLAGPLRSFLDGEMGLSSALLSAFTLVLASGLGGVKFCLLTRLTGSLWASMADHFVNNTLVNVLHVVTLSGVDSMQSIRITIAQTLSFAVVLFLYMRSDAKHKRTFRQPYLMQG